MANGNTFHRLFFQWMGFREGSHVHTLVIESNHGIEKVCTPFAHTGGINGQIAITVVVSYSRMICGAQLTSLLHNREMEWHPELGIGLAG